MALIMTWKPERYDITESDYAEYVRLTAVGAVVRFRWSIGRHRHGINIGDRAYLFRQGKDRRGLVGSGYVASNPFVDENWDPDGESEAWFVEVDWDDIRSIDDRVPVGELRRSVPRVPWQYLRSSGSPVGPDERVLEQVWGGNAQPAPVDLALGFPAEANEDAVELLRRLIGIPIFTVAGRLNRILGVSGSTVTVATDRSPRGKSVNIQDVQDALDLLRRDGSVEISPDSVGYRSAFVGAVLLTLPGGRTYNSPPIFTITSSVAADRGENDSVVTFEGDLSSYRTAEQRGEQAILRRVLIGSAQEYECALCGEIYPVQFIRAAHIKPRSVCDDRERRDLRNIAMAACVFGCDSLYEAGQISVGSDGVICAVPGVLEGAIATAVSRLEGRSVKIFSRRNSDYFAWHRENKLSA